MPALDGFFATPLIVFTFVLARVSGLVVSAPIFSGSYIPRQVRVFLAVGISLILLPTQWDAAIDAPRISPTSPS